MQYWLLAASTLTAAGKTILFKKIGVEVKSPKHLSGVNAISFLTASLAAISVTGFRIRELFDISGFSFGLSLLFATNMVITYAAQMKAMSLGTASSTMLIYSCGFLIPVFFGAICYREAISTVQILAIGLLTGALILIIDPERGRKISGKWLLYSLFAMTGSGTTAVLQKIHQRSAYAEEFPYLLSWMGLFAAGVLFLFTLYFQIREKRRVSKEHEIKLTGRQYVNAVITGLFVGILNLLNLRIAGKIPAIILFPVYNIGSIIISGIVCTFLFKEQNSKKQLWGFVTGCAAILLIGLF